MFSRVLDTLPQFGALVTNGQEELASLCYLVTMAWASANAAVTAGVGEYLEARLRELVECSGGVLTAFHGRRHLAALHFADVDRAKRAAQAANARGLDISVQTYKSTCPPAALLKLPLTADHAVVDAVVERLTDAVHSV
jgi:hypothetical protein